MKKIQETSHYQKHGLVVACRNILPDTGHKAVLPYWVIGLTTDGRCEHGEPNGRRFILEKGDFMIIRAGTPQSWRILGKTRWRGIDCVFDPRPHWISWMNWEECVPGFIKLTLHDPKVRREVQKGLLRAYQLGKSGLSDTMDFVYNAIENVILQANRYYQQTHHSRYDPRIDKAIRYLTENLHSPLNLEKVAAHSNLSRAHFACLFKKQVSVGPMAFQNQQRILQARQMLRMSLLSIKQIALELGFNNPKYFSTFFHRITGVTPQLYRMGK